jgi:hypothetical protein
MVDHRFRWGVVKQFFIINVFTAHATLLSCAMMIARRIWQGDTTHAKKFSKKATFSATC